MLPLIKLPSAGENITIKILEHVIPDPRKLHMSFGEHDSSKKYILGYSLQPLDQISINKIPGSQLPPPLGGGLSVMIGATVD